MTAEIVLGFIIIILYFHFSGKIAHLENEIRALKNKNPLEPEKFKEEKISFTQPKVQDSEEEKSNKPKVAFQNFETQKTEQEKEEEIPQIYERENTWVDYLVDFVKQNILTIIGILTLVLGIGYFVKYAIDKNWIGETARFSIGIITGLAILGVGYLIRKNYSIFSAIISGGGIATLYLSVTIAFQEYHLFSQTVAFILLILITLLTISISYLYDSEVLIIFALLGGFGSPLMVSTGQSNYPFLFTYITLLNIGMLVISYLKNWKSIGWISYFITFIYLFFWITDVTEQKTIYFILLFYVIFYSFALRNYIKQKNWDKFDILLLVITNISCVIAITYIFKDLNLEPIILFPLIFAGINGVLWFIEVKKQIEKIYNPVFVGLTISLITIAVALQFNAHIFTSIWAIEATLLLFLWLKTKQNIFKISALYLIPLVVIAEFFSWSTYNTSEISTFLLNKVFLTGFIISVSFGVNYFFIKKSKQNTALTFEYETIFKFLFYGNVYMIFLLEIMNFFDNYSDIFSLVTIILYTIYFALILVIFSKFLLEKKEEEIFLLIIPIFILILISIPDLLSEIIRNKLPYIYYLTYLVPLAFISWFAYERKLTQFKNYFYVISFSIVYWISMEFSHLYVLGNTSIINEISELKNHYIYFYLPIIWTILAIIFIYFGINNKIRDLVKAGFILIGIMAVKLYLLDVWNMDNISRIIAFIILGLILLSSSFMFQKLKDIIKELMENKQ